jgi:hypothetical protein
VDDVERRDALLDGWGLAPERVHTLPDPDSSQYQAALGDLVDGILAGSWPPPPALDVPELLQPSPATLIAGGQARDAGSAPTVEASQNLARGQADIMDRGYQVRSGIPLLGGVITWLRRNLTSHLREPYLDPALERQVAFNQSIVDWMAQIGSRLEALEDQFQAMEDRNSDAAPRGDLDRIRPKEDTDVE